MKAYDSKGKPALQKAARFIDDGDLSRAHDSIKYALRFGGCSVVDCHNVLGPERVAKMREFMKA